MKTSTYKARWAPLHWAVDFHKVCFLLEPLHTKMQTQDGLSNNAGSDTYLHTSQFIFSLFSVFLGIFFLTFCAVTTLCKNIQHQDLRCHVRSFTDTNRWKRQLHVRASPTEDGAGCKTYSCKHQDEIYPTSTSPRTEFRYAYSPYIHMNLEELRLLRCAVLHSAFLVRWIQTVWRNVAMPPCGHRVGSETERAGHCGWQEAHRHTLTTE